MRSEESTFEVWQDGMCVACASGDREVALREAAHYAAIYGQDGAVEIREVKKKKVNK